MEGDLTEGFLRYRFGGLIFEGLIHGGAYFRNIRVQWWRLIYVNFCPILVRYLFSLGKSLYGVYRNPQCYWECCFSVILSAQGGREIDGGVTDDDGDQDMETNQAQIDDVGVRIDQQKCTNP